MPETNTEASLSRSSVDESASPRLRLTEYVRAESPTMRLLELYLWMIASFAAAWPFVSDRLFYPTVELRDIYLAKGPWLFGAAGFLIFPFVFRLIFDAFPIQA